MEVLQAILMAINVAIFTVTSTLRNGASLLTFEPTFKWNNIISAPPVEPVIAPVTFEYDTAIPPYVPPNEDNSIFNTSTLFSAPNDTHDQPFYGMPVYQQPPLSQTTETWTKDIPLWWPEVDITAALCIFAGIVLFWSVYHRRAIVVVLSKMHRIGTLAATRPPALPHALLSDLQEAWLLEACSPRYSSLDICDILAENDRIHNKALYKSERSAKKIEGELDRVQRELRTTKRDLRTTTEELTEMKGNSKTARIMEASLKQRLKQVEATAKENERLLRREKEMHADTKFYLEECRIPVYEPMTLDTHHGYTA